MKRINWRQTLLDPGAGDRQRWPLKLILHFLAFSSDFPGIPIVWSTVLIDHWQLTFTINFLIFHHFPFYFYTFTWVIPFIIHLQERNLLLQFLEVLCSFPSLLNSKFINGEKILLSSWLQPPEWLVAVLSSILSDILPSDPAPTWLWMISTNTQRCQITQKVSKRWPPKGTDLTPLAPRNPPLPQTFIHIFKKCLHVLMTMIKRDMWSNDDQDHQDRRVIHTQVEIVIGQTILLILLTSENTGVGSKTFVYSLSSILRANSSFKDISWLKSK